MTKPLMVKKTSTATAPPGSTSGSTWWTTTSATARVRSPSSPLTRPVRDTADGKPRLARGATGAGGLRTPTAVSAPSCSFSATAVESGAFAMKEISSHLPAESSNPGAPNRKSRSHASLGVGCEDSNNDVFMTIKP